MWLTPHLVFWGIPIYDQHILERVMRELSLDIPDVVVKIHSVGFESGERLDSRCQGLGIACIVSKDAWRWRRGDYASERCLRHEEEEEEEEGARSCDLSRDAAEESLPEARRVERGSAAYLGGGVRARVRGARIQEGEREECVRVQAVHGRSRSGGTRMRLLKRGAEYQRGGLQVQNQEESTQWVHSHAEEPRVVRGSATVERVCGIPVRASGYGGGVQARRSRASCTEEYAPAPVKYTDGVEEGAAPADPPRNREAWLHKYLSISIFWRIAWIARQAC
ncbi:hypothetical protein C8R44DRAFT_948629 [Mycena epipterygia]|nr:hypothetical protein C8R44DRAFT_948629 [Mycena epipterygia]